MNENLFPTIIGQIRIRDADSSWKFFDIECATNTKNTISTSNTKELVCWKWETLILEKPSWNITFKVIKTKNPDLLWKILWLDVVNKIAGENTITDEKNIFDSDWNIELLHRSNDWNWVTDLVVKSADWWTTYVLDTDYTVAIADNKTIIKIKDWWAITEKAVVLVSWKVNENAYKKIKIEAVQRVKKRFSVELFWENQKTKWMTTIYSTPMTLDSEYVLEMIDSFRDWDISWSELTFKLCDGWDITIKDENI